MIVHKRALVLRVMEIFKSLGIRAGGRVLVSDLMAEWQKSGFRDADLHTATEAAINWGVLAHHPGGDDETFELLTVRIPPPPGEKPWLQRIWESTKDVGTIQRAGQRARRAKAAEQKRREDDTDSR